MKKLNGKEMAQVAGGYLKSSSTMSDEEIKRHKGSPVGKYDGVVGNTYLFESSHEIFTGKLLKTYEDGSSIYGDTVRTHEVQVMDFCVCQDYNLRCDFEVGCTATVSGDDFAMYEYIG